MTGPQAVSVEAVTPQVAEGAGSARDQFADLLAAHWDHLYRFACRLTGQTSEAEDLLQEAAAEAFAAFRRGRFQPGTRFDRWMMRILHNSFIDRLRRERRRQVFSLDDLTAATLAADPAWEPEGAAERRLDGPVARAVAALPPEFRAAVVLVDLEGLSYEEAADVLRCPVGTIRSRLHRGRLALREWLRPYLEAVGEVRHDGPPSG
jgi:RNA polymerase sigma-70 factor (ECF subfamily)